MNLIGTIIAMVRAGHGDAVIPSFVLDACLREGLAVAMLQEPVAAIDLYLFSQRGKQPTAVATEFAEALKKAAMRFGGRRHQTSQTGLLNGTT